MRNLFIIAALVAGGGMGTSGGLRGTDIGNGVACNEVDCRPSAAPVVACNEVDCRPSAAPVVACNQIDCRPVAACDGGNCIASQG